MFVFIVCYNYTSTTVGITTLVLGKPTPPRESEEPHNPGLFTCRKLH